MSNAECNAWIYDNITNPCIEDDQDHLIRDMVREFCCEKRQPFDIVICNPQTDCCNCESCVKVYEECKARENWPATPGRVISAFQNNWPQGINEGLVCARGKFAGKGFQAANKGDSGGPLYVTDRIKDKNIRKLVGIVSGNLGGGRCSPGQNCPSIYTRVKPFIPWIECIIRQVKKGTPYIYVQRRCMAHAKRFKKVLIPGLDWDIRNLGVIGLNLNNSNNLKKWCG